MATCQLCRAGLAGLGAAIKQWQQTCKDIEEILPAYVDDELAGVPVQARFPDVSKHLDECASCSRAHDELYNLLALEREGCLPEPPAYPDPHLPFLRAESRASRPPSWAIEMLDEAQDHLFAMITISKVYLANMFSPQLPAWGVRSGTGAGAQPTRFPVLDGLLGKKPWLVSVEIFWEPDISAGTGYWNLQVTLTGPTAPGKVEVTLMSGKEHRTAVVNKMGEAIFKDIPPAWLENRDTQPPDDRLNIQIQQIEA